MSILLSTLLAAAVGSECLLETKNTAMAFEKDARGVWRMLSYAERPASAADAKKLAWSPFVGPNDLGYRVPSTYITFGQKEFSEDVNKLGGFSVIHADGTLTTDLVHEQAELSEDAPGVRHLTLRLKDAVYPLRVIQHFRAFVACDVIETWVEIENGEDGPVKLVRMPSLSMLLPNVADEYHLLSLTGVHYCEGRVVESSIPCGRSEVLSARSGIWSSWGACPSFMLGLGSRPTERAGRVIGATLCWSGSWAVELAHDHVHHLSVIGGPDTSSGPYVLGAGQRIVLPKFALTYSASGKGAVSRNLHRWARDWRLPNGRALKSIPLCSWAVGFSFDEKKLLEMMDGARDLGGELFVVDDGWFGHGKYARDAKHGDRVGLGDWHVNREIIPSGLDGLAQAAKSRGLDFGIWIEPEMVNTNSWFYEAHPDWVLAEKTRPLYARRGGSQLVLDMTRPVVRKNIFEQLDTLYSGIPGLAYVKWDANADFSCIGSPALPADAQANVWFDYVNGVYDLMRWLRAKYPSLTVQACASGGGRMDYGVLEFTDEFWASDNVDPRERVFIQWGASQFFPASTIASHLAPCPNWHLRRTTPIKYRCDVAMSARYGFEFDPKELSKEELDCVRKSTAAYKAIRPIVQLGDLYRLVSPFEKEYAALMYVAEDKSRAVVFVYGLSRSGYRDGFPTPLALEGLDADSNYDVTELVPGRRPHIQINGAALAGRSLMSLGLPIRLEPGDWDSMVILLERK